MFAKRINIEIRRHSLCRFIIAVGFYKPIYNLSFPHLTQPLVFKFATWYHATALINWFLLSKGKGRIIYGEYCTTGTHCGLMQSRRRIWLLISRRRYHHEHNPSAMPVVGRNPQAQAAHWKRTPQLKLVILLFLLIVSLVSLDNFRIA